MLALGFLLGIICGLLLAILVVQTAPYWRTPVENKLEQIKADVHPKGEILKNPSKVIKSTFDL